MKLLALARAALHTTPPIPPANGAGGRHWLIRRSDGVLLEVIFGDAVSAADVRAAYPDAVTLTRQDACRRRATLAEATELRTLVAAVLADDAERVEALAVALADADAALACYRALTVAVPDQPCARTHEAPVSGDCTKSIA